MLGPDLEYCRDVLNVYASLTKLNCVMTNKEGKLVTPIAGEPDIFRLFYEKETLAEVLTQRAGDFSKINGPIVYDELPGIKVIICPIYLQGQIEFFVFAGCILEHSTKHSVETYLEKMFNDPEKAKTILSFIKEHTPDEIQAKMNKIKKMTDILYERLSTQKLKQHLAEQEENLNEILQLISVDDIKITTVLQRFFYENNKVDFVGYARKKGQDEFIIEDSILSFDNSLKGTIFSTGEGILGQAAATRTARFWDHTDWDPRNKFFHQRGIYPKSIFCFPIIQDQEVAGVFFGGSCVFDHIEKEVSREGKVTSLLIKVIENKRSWQEQAKNNLLKITALNEIFQVMIAVQDLKRILFIMLDMSINLFRGPFVAVILDQPARNSFEIFSRGLTSTQIDQYSNDISNRYYLDGQNRQGIPHQPLEYATSWFDKVLEFPIAYRDHHFGYLCIGLTDIMLEEDERSFLNSLTIAGGLAIHLLEASNKVEMEQTVIDLLVDLQEYIDPEHYRKASKARDIIKGFSDYLAQGQLNTLAVKYSCYFILYDEQFLKEKISNEQIIDILREYRLVVNSQIEISQASINVQVLTIVWSYINSEENNDALSKINGINPDLLNDFITYLSYSNVNELEVSLNRLRPNTIEPNISRNLNLSKREMDVVKLVLEGKNNRTIAESLFISEHTVKNHMTNIFQKLAVNDRSQAIAKIYQMGFLPEDVS
ncbi:LuxR C-terminal-related transcriptional regulator [Neobacillus sp. LXY-4]|uniref:LuxR C-terminal-related transcriptional regulator n=1 Tax=Neobacillus sp. LXY-4 TaxID=3379826 RepID=UPI003EE3D627